MMSVMPSSAKSGSKSPNPSMSSNSTMTSWRCSDWFSWMRCSTTISLTISESWRDSSSRCSLAATSVSMRWRMSGYIRGAASLTLLLRCGAGRAAAAAATGITLLDWRSSSAAGFGAGADAAAAGGGGASGWLGRISGKLGRRRGSSSLRPRRPNMLGAPLQETGQTRTRAQRARQFRLRGRRGLLVGFRLEAAQPHGDVAQGSGRLGVAHRRGEHAAGRGGGERRAGFERHGEIEMDGGHVLEFGLGDLAAMLGADVVADDQVARGGGQRLHEIREPQRVARRGKRQIGDDADGAGERQQAANVLAEIAGKVDDDEIVVAAQYVEHGVDGALRDMALVDQRLLGRRPLEPRAFLQHRRAQQSAGDPRRIFVRLAQARGGHEGE